MQNLKKLIWHERKYPELKWLHHIPNGGKRDKVTAARLKAGGIKAGVPDICLPVPRRTYHGLYIELKSGRNGPTKEQKKWLVGLTENGYMAVVCYGYDEAVKVIVEYLECRCGTE